MISFIAAISRLCRNYEYCPVLYCCSASVCKWDNVTVSGRITVGPRGGLAHLKDLAAPAKHLFWEGWRGPVKDPLEIARWSPINPSLQRVILSTHAGVVVWYGILGFNVFRQMILSDDQTRNHYLMILCAGLQLHMLTKSRLLCN